MMAVSPAPPSAVCSSLHSPGVQHDPLLLLVSNTASQHLHDSWVRASSERHIAGATQVVCFIRVACLVSFESRYGTCAILPAACTVAWVPVCSAECSTVEWQWRQMHASMASTRLQCSTSQRLDDIGQRREGAVNLLALLKSEALSSRLCHSYTGHTCQYGDGLHALAAVDADMQMPCQRQQWRP